ncbi:hypothetical protein ACH4C6_21750 [Streptomyces sp. NPDC017943]|uniref:hypothetical protein n=1 Tax=Streptomyces sp. NPDC017943 TaxID=3365019 RepID=UPI0037AFFA6D
MTITRYRKRPVEVDTIQWTGDNAAELVEFTGHRFEAIPPEARAEKPDVTAQVYDELHDTWVGVKTGQHIVRGVHGEFYPIAEDVLAETYEPAAEPAESPLRDLIAAAIYERNNPGHRWAKAHPDDRVCYGNDADAALSVVQPGALITATLARLANADMQRVIALYERWVKAGPPPLGTSVSRWWDARLVELNEAILPSADQPKEQ